MEVGWGWALGKMIGKEDSGRCWTLALRSLGLGRRYACCFLDIPAFALFQCFLTFQHSRLVYIYIYIYIYIQKWHRGTSWTVFWILPAGWGQHGGGQAWSVCRSVMVLKYSTE
jgi:hypothetical protein